MSKDQIRVELQSYITQLDQQQHLVISAHEKFRIALASTLKLLGDGSTTLKHLHGTPDDLKGYLIQLSNSLFDTTKNAFEHLRKGIQPVQELM